MMIKNFLQYHTTAIVAGLLLFTFAIITFSSSCNFLDLDHPFDFIQANSCQEHSIDSAQPHTGLFQNVITPNPILKFVLILVIVLLPQRQTSFKVDQIRQKVFFRVNRLLKWIWARCCIFLQKSFFPFFCAQRDY